MNLSKVSTPATILITGFEPFGGSSLNPSQLIAESLVEVLDGKPGFAGLHTALLPVDTERIAEVIEALWDKHRPDVVLHFGESAKADRLTLERVAINLLDFDTPDNAGVRLTDKPIDPDGPAARFATLPVRAIQEGLAEMDIASGLSLSAGAYLCNQALYLSLGHADQRGGAAVGFVHVPSLPEQVAQGERSGPTMPRKQLLASAAALVRLSVGA